MNSEKYLPESQMFPYIRKAIYFDTDKVGISSDIPQRITESYELSFFDSGSGHFYIDQKAYDIRPGAVRFTRPGQTIYGVAPYSCYSIFFDLLDLFDESTTGNRSKFHSGCKNPACNSFHNEVIDSFPSFFYTAGNQKNAFSETVELFYQGGIGSTFRQNALLMHILSSYYYVVVWQKGRSPMVQKCVQYIQRNYTEKITLELLSSMSNYSALHIRRKFLSEMGMSPNEFLLSVRLTNAKKMLAETSTSIRTIALNCGFTSEAYFYTAFRSEFGITPGEYREIVQNS